MNQATLIVSRVNDTELRFVLQRSPLQRSPVVFQESMRLRPEQRQQIHAGLKDFAECLEGRAADEPKFLELGQVLFRVLLPETIRVALAAVEEPLAILTDDPTLPWEILHDGDEFLTLKLPVSRQLIIHRQMAGLLRPPTPPAREGFAALVIADPLGDLPGARAEGEALAPLFRRLGDCDLLVGSEATWDNIQRRLVRRGYSVIHYCGHMEYDGAKRLSSIPFQGGGCLSADEVLSTFRGNPVVLHNACHSDPQVKTPTPGRAESFARTESFAQAFMLGNERGVAAAVIGTMWLVPDEPEDCGREFSRSFYEALLGGTSVGEALRGCRLMARQRQWGPMVWGPYVLYGDPCLAPFAAQPETPAQPAAASASGAAAQRTRDMTRKPPPPTPSTPPPAPGIPEASQRQFEGASPLDDTGRQVFHSALREMAAMGHGTMSSMHLLLGLSEAGIGALEEALDEAELDAQCLCNRTRRRAKKLLAGEDQGGGISLNVLQILAAATARAGQFEKEKITSEDLLASLLKCEDSEAVRILTAFGVSRENLLARLPRPVPKPEPVLGEWPFDAQAKEAMQRAVESARQAHLDFLGTPHLLIGLLRAGGRTAELVRRQRVDIERLCSVLAESVGQGFPGMSAGPLTLRPRSRAILQRAADLGRAVGLKEVTEEHVFRAVLEESQGATAEVLRALRVDVGPILEVLRGKTGPG